MCCLKRRCKMCVNSSFHVFLNGGRIDTSLDALKWIEKGVLLGAGEVVVNSIDPDGVKMGLMKN